MNSKEIEHYVTKWMDSHEPGTFVANEHGNFIYKSGPSMLNLKVFFEELLKDFEDEYKAPEPKDSMGYIIATDHTNKKVPINIRYVKQVSKFDANGEIFAVIFMDNHEHIVRESVSEINQMILKLTT